MWKKALILVAALLTLAGVLAPAAEAANNGQRVKLFEVTVNIENLAPADGTAQTPVWLGIHDGSFDLYDRGAPVTPGLESLAEDGSTSTLSAEFAASGAGFDTTVAADQGIPPLLPGESGSFTFLIDARRGEPQYLSYASMVLPSNDAFIANGNPTAIPVINDRGRFVRSTTVVLGSEVLDAGTEVNDEAPESTAFFGQAAPNTGETEGGVVTLHPGFIPEGRILSAPQFANADFTAADYEALKITTTAQRVVRTVVADLDGGQEVPAVDTAATGEARLRLRADGDIAYRIAATDLDNLAAAHLHLGASGENGPVIVNLLGIADARITDNGFVTNGRISAADLVGPLAEAGTLDLWSEILAGNVYINVHTSDVPSGEIRGDLSR